MAGKTVSAMYTFFNAAHKEELKKIAQGTQEASHVIELTSKIEYLEALSIQQTHKINELVDGHQELQTTVSSELTSATGDTSITALAQSQA